MARKCAICLDPLSTVQDQICTLCHESNCEAYRRQMKREYTASRLKKTLAMPAPIVRPRVRRPKKPRIQHDEMPKYFWRGKWRK